MKRPVFLALDEILALHADQIHRYGGSLGIRDPGLLESAISTPKTMFSGSYLHADLAEMAAAYLFHLVRNHPFLDGNKRTGLMTAFVFLGLNGLELEAEEDEVAALIIGIAAGNVSKAQATVFIERHGRPRRA